MKIVDKIKTRRYASLGRALSAVNRSALTKSEKKELLKLAQDVYSQPLPVDVVQNIKAPTVKRDRIEETADIGKRFQEQDGVESDIMRLALWTMGTMAKHHLSREQVFDRLKETLANAMGIRG